MYELLPASRPVHRMELSTGISLYQTNKNVYRQRIILLSVHIFDFLTAEMESEIIQSVYHPADSKESYTDFAEKMCMSS